MECEERVPILSAKLLARTYDHPSYGDAWDCVSDYQRFLEYTGTHPEKGSSAVGSALELPRSRVRPWMEGSIPNPVKAIQIAEKHNWLNAARDSPEFRGLNVLVAWLISGGSIRNDAFVPQFVIDDPIDTEFLCTAGEAIGIEFSKTRDDTSGRAEEFRPIEHASILGRVLWILGVPLGRKNNSTTLEIPLYLYDAPRVVKKEFVSIYIHNRGVNLKRHSGPIRFREERPKSYLKLLKNFFQRVIQDEVFLHGKNIHLPTTTADRIRQWQVPLADLELGR